MLIFLKGQIQGKIKTLPQIFRIGLLMLAVLSVLLRLSSYWDLHM